MVGASTWGGLDRTKGEGGTGAGYGRVAGTLSRCNVWTGSRRRSRCGGGPTRATFAGLCDVRGHEAVGGRGMEDEIHLLLAVRRPEVDGNNEKVDVNVARKSTLKRGGARVGEGDRLDV